MALRFAAPLPSPEIIRCQLPRPRRSTGYGDSLNGLRGEKLFDNIALIGADVGLYNHKDWLNEIDFALTTRELGWWMMEFNLDPKTLEELSQVYGVSRERVRQIEVRAFEKLQKAMMRLVGEKRLVTSG